MMDSKLIEEILPHGVALANSTPVLCVVVIRKGTGLGTQIFGIHACYFGQFP